MAFQHMVSAQYILASVYENGEKEQELMIYISLSRNDQIRELFKNSKVPKQIKDEDIKGSSLGLRPPPPWGALYYHFTISQ